jgi:hypothetical protein
MDMIDQLVLTAIILMFIAITGMTADKGKENRYDPTQDYYRG